MMIKISLQAKMTYKIIYTSDLHGNESLYGGLLSKAEVEGVNAVVIGATCAQKATAPLGIKSAGKNISSKNF